MGVNERLRRKIRGKKQSHSEASEAKSSGRVGSSRTQKRLFACACIWPSKGLGSSLGATDRGWLVFTYKTSF